MADVASPQPGDPWGVGTMKKYSQDVSDTDSYGTKHDQMMTTRRGQSLTKKWLLYKPLRKQPHRANYSLTSMQGCKLYQDTSSPVQLCLSHMLLSRASGSHIMRVASTMTLAAMDAFQMSPQLTLSLVLKLKAAAPSMG